MGNLRLTSLLRSSVAATSRSTKRIVTDFAEEVGMVYFGYVSQRDDEHHIVRGMTVSTKHHDDHYCIGTFEGYDVVFVERSDTLKNGRKHQWHIMEFDLKHARDVPHTFIGSGKHGLGFHELLSIKYPALQPIEVGSTAPYPRSFHDSYQIYSAPGHAVYLESIITPDIAAMIAKHFRGLVLEITDQALYVYSEKNHVSKELLLAMLQNGAWLAGQIDKK